MKNLIFILLGLIWMITACKTIPKQEVDPYTFNIEAIFYKHRSFKHPTYVLKVVNSNLIAVCNNENDSTQISIKLNKADLDSIQYLSNQITIGDTSGGLWVSHSWGANLYINEKLLYYRPFFRMSDEPNDHNRLILFLIRKSPVNIELYGLR
jgi:hypothetical protein